MSSKIRQAPISATASTSSPEMPVSNLVGDSKRVWATPGWVDLPQSVDLVYEHVVTAEHIYLRDPKYRRHPGFYTITQVIAKNADTGDTELIWQGDVRAGDEGGHYQIEFVQFDPIRTKEITVRFGLGSNQVEAGKVFLMLERVELFGEQ